jgi:site-specific DNA-methyltransferase (adenine-specific)
MGYHYRARYECILFFEKGKRRLSDLGIPDIIEAPRVYNGYPTEKPVEVADVLIRQSSAPGELVIDPFMGSGSTGVAAVRAGRRFAGTDVNEGAVRITAERLAALRVGRRANTNSPPESCDSRKRLRTIVGGEAACLP